MAYTSVSFTSLITSLSERLSDNANEFWSVNEVRSYLVEALRTWQVFSALFNVRVTLPTVANTLFYDLFKLVPELTPSVRDADVAIDIAYALQEPWSNGWQGTEQFTRANVYQAIQQRRDRFLLETGLVVNNTVLSGPSPSALTVDLPQNVMDIRSVFWKNDSNGPYSVLWRLDKFTEASKPYQNLTPDIPTDYSTYPLRPLVLEISPPPLVGGTLNLLTTNSGVVLDPSNPSILGIPDDFCWVVKFGALADIFATDGPGQDDARATYCESRWREGIALARITNFVHIGQNNGIPWFIDTLHELNSGDPLWISRTPGQPETLALAGNIVATGPIADNVYSMTFDIMPRFKVPPSDSSFVQIGPEVVDVILDYAQHLADVKEGANELKNSTRQYENLIQLAATMNDRLRAQGQNFDALNSRSTREHKENLRRISTLKSKELDYAN